MIANLLISRRLEPSALAAALADVVGVPAEQVDVCHADGDQDHREWEAAVLCTYHYVRGDVVMSLDVQVRDDVDGPAGEAELAAAFAERTGTGVVYPDDRIDPETFWLADPSGTVTRTRLVASEDEHDEEHEPPTYSVDAVEAPSLAFPDAEVTPLAEILREVPILTPVADAVGLDTPAVVSLTIWERMVRRMAGDWAPSGRYLPELYAEDLAARDHLEREIAACPEQEREVLLAAAAEVDSLFRSLTEEGSAAASAGAGWWRSRRPRRMPWPDTGKDG
ncbi:hypothetical protein [Streptomyces formicae]|uniref:Uncharacterized protein n=1 Tax=Streptomyces formicae TaxID=1616117 RepID=A0ABY3WFU6_9ACTN|nr:hypothetical protein [Streptomyces formicae]UNM11035.1 hypothetical protein J4032_05480 [Streptomyces formicae]